MDERPARHYIIVVHGIGDQAENITPVEVIHRFAEVRSGTPQQVQYQALLPANVSSLSVRRKG